MFLLLLRNIIYTNIQWPCTYCWPPVKPEVTRCDLVKMIAFAWFITFACSSGEPIVLPNWRQIMLDFSENVFSKHISSQSINAVHWFRFYRFISSPFRFLRWLIRELRQITKRDCSRSAGNSATGSWLDYTELFLAGCFFHFICKDTTKISHLTIRCWLSILWEI
jgi:hypothetical protein